MSEESKRSPEAEDAKPPRPPSNGNGGAGPPPAMAKRPSLFLTFEHSEAMRRRSLRFGGSADPQPQQQPQQQLPPRREGSIRSLGSFRAGSDGSSKDGSRVATPRQSDPAGLLSPRVGFAPSGAFSDSDGSVMEAEQVEQVASLYEEESEVMAQLFPCLHDPRSPFDDNLLEEVLNVLDDKRTIITAPLSVWSAVPRGTACMFYITDDRPCLIGGMVLLGGEYILGSMPFVQTKDTQLRCCLDPVAQEDARVDAMDVEPVFKWFKFQEYVAANSNVGWSVHVFTKVLPPGETRSLYMVRAVCAHALMSPNSRRNMKRRGGRQPLVTERYLVRQNPALLQWCLSREVNELDSSTVLVRNAIHYYKNFFSVVKVVSLLRQAAVKIQRCTRRMLGAKHHAMTSIHAKWTEMENAHFATLEKELKTTTDPIEKVITSVLLDNAKTSDAHKATIIRAEWDQRKHIFKRSITRSKVTAAMRVVPRFSWALDVSTMMERSHRQLAEDLSRGNSQIFLHPDVQRMMADVPKASPPRPPGSTSRGALDSRRTVHSRNTNASRASHGEGGRSVSPARSPQPLHGVGVDVRGVPVLSPVPLINVEADTPALPQFHKPGTAPVRPTLPPSRQRPSPGHGAEGGVSPTKRGFAAPRGVSTASGPLKPTAPRISPGATV